MKSRFISGVVKKILKYKKSGSVLDVGTSSGRHSIFLARKGFRVTAVEIEKDKVTALRKLVKSKKLNVVVKEGDLRKLKSKKKFDVVVATMVMHFLKKWELPRAFRLLKSLVRPRGLTAVLVLTAKNRGKHIRPHLFAVGELQKYYSDWEVLYHWEGLGKPFRDIRTKKFIRQYSEGILARR